MPLAFYLDFATKQEGLRRFIDSKGLLTPWIGSLSCRPLPPSDNKGRDLAVIKQILHGYILSERKIRDPMILPVKQGGYYSYGATVLEKIPLCYPKGKMAEYILSLVEEIISEKKRDISSDTTALESEIDRLVYQLYGLTEEEIAIIEKK